VCENPAVVLAAANALGPAGPPLVCVGGQPTAAVVRLLTHLAEAGCALHYHGDFDWGGIRIANLLWGRLPMRAWRFDTRSYVERVPRRSAPLRGRPVAAVWDPDLRPAIERHGVRLAEEAVLADLLADLTRGEPGGPSEPGGASEPGGPSEPGGASEPGGPGGVSEPDEARGPSRGAR
jgi:uncharacterized protein (TIGR02679 family)